MLSALLLLCIISATAQQAYPKREFRGAWIQCVNGQFQGMSPQVMKSTLIKQLDNLKGAGINAVIFRYAPSAMHSISRNTNRGAVSLQECKVFRQAPCGIRFSL